MLKLFWLILSVVCVGWYLIVLGYVTVKGGADIKEMLKKLSVSPSAKQNDDNEAS